MIIRKIPGTQGKYKITYSGTVTDGITNKKVMPSINDKGYRTVKITINGKNDDYRIDKLVAGIWVSNPKNKIRLIHKDGKKLNENYQNLNWATKEEQLSFKKKVKQKVVKSGPARISLICTDIRNNKTQKFNSPKEAEAKTGLKAQVIRKAIRTGKPINNFKFTKQ